jgi:ribosomal-protein-alanine N-acetyltransferase
VGGGAWAAVARHVSRRLSRRAAPVAPEGLDVVVRAADARDLPAVIAIECDAFSDPWPASAFAEAIAAEHMHFVVATAGGAVVAYLIGWFAGGDGEIANIAVAADARGHGIGGRLLDEALALAWERGSVTVHLEVRASNLPAQGLYGSRGFVPVGRRQGYYREPLEDAIVLRRTRDD